VGAERYLDPKLMATLLRQRQSIIVEWGITNATETMLGDLAVVQYALALRVHGWIGDLAARIESEFFGDDAFTEVVKGHGSLRGRRTRATAPGCASSHTASRRWRHGRSGGRGPGSNTG
jgi:hypothetical protein